MSVTGEAKTTAAAGAWPRTAWANVVAGVATIVRAPRSKARPAWRTPVRVTVGALVAAGATVAVMLVFDGWAARAKTVSPDWLLAAFAAVTDFGKSGWFLFPIGGLLFAIALLASSARVPISRMVLAAVAVRLGFLFTAIAVPSLFSSVLKRVIGRARPFMSDHLDPYLYAPFIWRSDHASLPSGHATTAFSALVAIGLLWPRLRAPMLVYALVIAASRVVVGVHFASDVVAGAVVGSAGVLLVRDWFAARRLGFAIGTDGRVHALPGPTFARIKRVARRLLAP